MYHIIGGAVDLHSGCFFMHRLSRSSQRACDYMLLPQHLQGTFKNHYYKPASLFFHPDLLGSFVPGGGVLLPHMSSHVRQRLRSGHQQAPSNSSPRPLPRIHRWTIAQCHVYYVQSRVHFFLHTVVNVPVL